jgi:MATE family multidrug resistance protein
MVRELRQVADDAILPGFNDLRSLILETSREQESNRFLGPLYAELTDRGLMPELARDLVRKVEMELGLHDVGRGDLLAIARGLLIAWAGALTLIAGQALLFAGALWIAPASSAVETLTRDYLAIRIWGAPAAISLYVVTGWLVAQERTGAVLVLQLWMNGLNIALNLAFVLGLGWGVAGVAWASLIAEWSGLALGLWLCRAVFEGRAWRDRARILDPARLRRMLAVNRDILLRNLAITLAFAGFLFLSSGLGDVPLAANQVLMQFFSLMAFALDGFAYAAETLVGQAVGARDRASLRQTVRIVLIWGGIGALLLALSFWLLGPWIIALMTTAPEVRAVAERHLIWLILAPLAATWSFMLDGIYFGATWTRDLLIAMAQSVAIYGVALAVLMPLWGNHGLWAAMTVFSLARAVTLARRYKRLARAV